MGFSPGEPGLALVYPSSEESLAEPIRADVVFVHGLNGDPAHTWHAKGDAGTDVCWLYDNSFLPKIIPFSRIFTFKYNARVFHYNSDAKLENIASNLLAQIKSNRTRQEEYSRKLIFVCHSLGGLVVKQALILANQPSEKKAVQDATSGIIFLGTPHGGSHLARTLAMAAAVIDSPRHLVDVLTVGSSSLKSLVDGFARYYKFRLAGTNGSKPLSIASFGEMYRTSGRLPLLAFQVVPVEYAKTGLSEEEFTEVEKDHRTICRFRTPDDPVYQMIAQQLSKWIPGLQMRYPVDGSPHRQTTNRSNSAEQDQSLSERYYDVGLATDRFCGRQQDLDYIRNALSHSDPTSHHSIAVWGLGAMGKTQLVLHYAFVHNEEYRTLWLFNARSEKDLKASIERFFDHLIQKNDQRLLKTAGKNCKDKCSAVLKWFEEEKNSLMIYDDVDLEPPFDLRAYIPQHSAGHRILISRSPQVADYAERSLELREMTKVDAARMLMLRSDKALPESLTELPDIAVRITTELDRIPGFIEIAAKYILHHQVSLSEYLSILMNQKQNMRLASPKSVLGDVYASWEIALKALAPDGPSLLLLKLFVFLDGATISPTLLHRAHTVCLRWEESGRARTRSPEASHIDTAVVALLEDDVKFNDAIMPLINASFLRREQTETGSIIQMPQTIQHFVRRAMGQDERLRWMSIAVSVVSHALPEEPNLEANFETLRTDLSPHVFRCLEHAQQYKMQQLEPILPQLTFMLLCTLARSGMELDYIDELVAQSSDGYFRCSAAKWRAYKYFYKDRKGEAEALLATAQQVEAQKTAHRGRLENARSHAALGDMIMHRAQFLFSEERSNEGRDILSSWEPQYQSPLEERVSLYINTALAKMLIAKGQHMEAVKALEDIMSRAATSSEEGAFKQSDLNWATFILSEVYCSHGRFTDAIKLLQPKVDTLLSLHAQSEFITSDFRILLCEARLRLGQFEKAMSDSRALHEDLRLPSQVGNPRSHDQLLEAKCLIARCFHTQHQWQQAAKAWREVLTLLGVEEEDIPERKFERKYADVVAIYSLGVVYFHLGDKAKAKQYIKIVEEDSESQKPPPSKTEYTSWFPTVKEEFKTALAGSGKGFSHFFGCATGGL